MMKSWLDNKLVKFALVGGVGFVADTLVFAISFKLLLMPILSARLVAFVCAATVTWLGNRLFTFCTSSQIEPWSFWGTLKQWGKFMLSASISAIPNLLLFKAIIILFGSEGFVPFAALVAGILVGMFSNFLLSSRWVFQPSQDKSN